MADRIAEREVFYPFDNGVWWVDDVGGFHVAGIQDDSFDSIFMRHLGQVRLAVTSADINIKWDSARVNMESLMAVVDRLSGCRIDCPVSLDFYFHGWSSETGLNPQQAIARIKRVQAIYDVDILHSTSIEERPVSEITNALHPFGRSFDAWRQSNGRLPRYSNDTLAWYLPRVSIYRPDSKVNDVVFSWIGSQTLAMRVHGRKWASDALGQSLRQPQGSEEENYVDQTSAAYEEVWTTGEPRYQYIRSLSFQDGVEPEWLHYARLLTRCILHDGTQALVCQSRLVRGVPLPLPGTP